MSVCEILFSRVFGFWFLLCAHWWGLQWSVQLYPIAVVIGGALGLCGFCMARNLSINPDVRFGNFSVVLYQFLVFPSLLLPIAWFINLYVCLSWNEEENLFVWDCWILSHGFGAEMKSVYGNCRINKDDRAAGVLENFKEGKAYKDHSFKRYVADHVRYKTPKEWEHFDPTLGSAF